MLPETVIISRTDTKNSSHVELATFYLGDACCGINILSVQEINKLTEVTPVPLAPEYVKGVLNIRGNIISLIDAGKRLGISSELEKKKQMNIIVLFENESIGLLIDRIGEVVRAEKENIEEPPANVGVIQRKYIEGVLKTEKELICVLNLNNLLGKNNSPFQRL